MRISLISCLREPAHEAERAYRSGKQSQRRRRRLPSYLLSIDVALQITIEQESNLILIRGGCRFLIDTFGRERLGQGSGVLDIGGGRGELSFELLNLNNIRATIVDPRPGSLGKQAKWLKVKLCSFA